ncbi:Octanoyltransferase [Limihaloglobus sulfuriphilus]|uniref:Octanoyltransferase n=1 Tax=Limihaloglobus sulfuriphilus TaxID=1851148 RepID=A0A1Q2MBS0_9BACT|nr:lipoyl(octanoyl) transferase LipB [Limihaloglobus sulfuriphilus]AQQ69978.1 Octanoyltransferase [Limihaloglobus sulfuriphilus]
MQKDGSSVLSIRDLGITDYGKALELQKTMLSRRILGEIPNTVMITEHNPVITLGARESENKLVAAPERIEEAGISIYPVRRGGGTTAHNPGQLVIYPIIDLRSIKLGINEYIRALEQTGIELLETMGIHAGRKKGFPGIWTNSGKIASIGVKVSQGTTYHGMAINICNDLSIFEMIIPCGIDNVKMVSAQSLGSDAAIETAKNAISKILKRTFL